jgi:hypothetical protein
MTTYAYDTRTHQLVAVWDTGIGATARLVARLNAATEDRVGLHLAQALTRMSEAVWRHATYLRCNFDPGCSETEWSQHARTHFDAAVREEAAARAPERMPELVVPSA